LLKIKAPSREKLSRIIVHTESFSMPMKNIFLDDKQISNRLNKINVEQKMTLKFIF